MTSGGFRDLPGAVEEGDLRFVLNAASGYSPWNASSMADGYLTAPGGHRIGVCGETAGEGIKTVTSACIRIARDIRGVAEGIPTDGSILILGPPGSGKTTLLRDHIRIRSKNETVAVVDERRELFPEGFSRGENTDILSGTPKGRGIDMVLRSMGPSVIAMDEITCPEDCEALVRAAWCGVHLLATAHASSVRDLHERSIYRPLVETGLFSRAVVLDRHRQWKIEEVAR
jgi:stage III sporulation protein AA